MRIILLGPPGSGKAELSRMISSHYGMPIITVNSVMRRAAASQSELGRLAKEAMAMSRVSDELLLALLRIQLPQTDLSKGFVLVDLPKNAGQAEVLDSLLADLSAGVELVLNLEVDRDELMERLVGRIACDSCNAQYNLYVNPPLVDGICDECGARVVRRPDDYEETISNRLRIYEGQMGPLLQYYHLSERLQRLAADAGPGSAWKALRKQIDAMPRSVPPGGNEQPATAVAPTKSKVAGTSAAKEAAREKATRKPMAAVKKVVAKAAPGGKTSATKHVAPGKASVATKKSIAKKASAGKPASKKVVAKKATAKKVVSKKVVAKKAVAKKVVSKKVVAKKTVSKKMVAKKAVAKKPASKKVVSKKATAKKAVSKKVVAKKTAAKKATAKKVASKKTIAKKITAKRAVAKKPLAKKAPAKKAVARKAPTPKAVKKSVAKRTAPAKAKQVAKKSTPKKAAASRKKAKRR